MGQCWFSVQSLVWLISSYCYNTHAHKYFLTSCTKKQRCEINTSAESTWVFTVFTMLQLIDVSPTPVLDKTEGGL